MTGLIERLTGHRLTEANRERVLYLLVGIWNTVFGLGVYALLCFLFAQRINYLLILIPTNIIAITNAYICYKFIVFRTRGSVLREYLRFYVVYGIGMGASALIVWLLVAHIGMQPIWANCLATAVVVVLSYVGHKFFSFRKTLSDPPVVTLAKPSPHLEHLGTENPSP